ncbi:hypothetical protein GL4_0931 [Methyloceanibacter caenitepidi]|uniref:Uncharacterized protein n=1 Tax=Methyloceanibacter caenitepidi TaxID=1384459 RepID=A0A0A8K0W6_9HYPH|nr:hypothetical protein GL4_0931 [Methyloceanibacter caenitepidi]
MDPTLVAPRSRRGITMLGGPGGIWRCVANRGKLCSDSVRNPGEIWRDGDRRTRDDTDACFLSSASRRFERGTDAAQRRCF